MTRTRIPVIETQRLILRGPEPEDYPNFKATFTSYRARFMGGPLNSYEAWMLYAAEIGHWDIRGYGMWMIHDRATDRTLGVAGSRRSGRSGKSRGSSGRMWRGMAMRLKRRMRFALTFTRSWDGRAQ
jgi:RimJ/RimL family protein N-acetyltransferase